MNVLRRRRNQQVGYSLAATLVVTVMALEVSAANVILLNVFLTFVVLGVTLDLLLGDLALFAGCHAAFFGAGGYISILLWQDQGWPLPLAGVAAVLMVAVLALLIGWPGTTRT